MVEQLEKSNSFTIIGMSFGKVTKGTDSQKAVMDILGDIHGSSGNIPYDDLTAVVYKDVTFFNKKLKKDEFQEFINDCKKVLQTSDIEDKEKDAYQKYLNKINRHVSLAIIQRGFIESISLDAEKKIDDLKKEIDIATESILKSEENLKIAEGNLATAEKKLSETKGNMYTEFIAILGIFSALIFGLFGSFDAVSSALTKISENSSISEVIVFSCIIIVPLLILIYGLLYWVGKLANKKLKSCNCEEQECNCNLFDKHKTFFILLALIVTVGIIGLMGILLDLLPIKSELGILIQISILLIIMLNIIKFIYNIIFDRMFQWKRWYLKHPWVYSSLFIAVVLVTLWLNNFHLIDLLQK